MAKTAVERMQAYRLRIRNEKELKGKLRPVGRPKKVVRIPHTRQCRRIEHIVYSVWCDLRKEDVTELSFRSLRHRANKYATRYNGNQLTPQEVRWGVRSQLGNDHFYCEGESEAGLPLKIMVTDPA